MSRCQSGFSHARERGSALLIVFVFAAIIAIFLYREIPVAVFEAKRQKEQLLVDRGNEYVRAIQLYYRRNRGQFPASIEQLESTNNIRYLRRRYKDPFTGKDDWRLLHAGPNGLLIDSKVNPVNAQGVPGQTGGLSPFGSSSTSSVSSTPSADSSSSAGVVVPPLAQRGPEMPANGAGGAGSLDQPPTSAQLDQNPDLPLASGASLQPGAGPVFGRGGTPPVPPLDGSFPVPPQPGDALGPNNPQSPNVMQTLSPILGSPSTGGAQAIAAAQGGGQPAFGAGLNTGSSLGQLNGGGALAGVASIAKGHSIKLVGDQDDYSLWEFHYDPSKDTSLSNGTNQGTGLQLQQNGQPSTGNQTSGFGNQSGSQSGFGQAAPNQPATDTNQNNSNQNAPAQPAPQ